MYGFPLKKPLLGSQKQATKAFFPRKKGPLLVGTLLCFLLTKAVFARQIAYVSLENKKTKSRGCKVVSWSR